MSDLNRGCLVGIVRYFFCFHTEICRHDKFTQSFIGFSHVLPNSLLQAKFGESLLYYLHSNDGLMNFSFSWQNIKLRRQTLYV
jgi:hypothetical protein